MAHSGLIGRAKVKSRHQRKHIRKGLCSLCSRSLSNRSRWRCDYHLEKNIEYKNKKKKLEELGKC